MWGGLTINNKNLNKFITIIIYFLVVFLICLLSYNLFLLINKNYYLTESPKNSIKVGPILVE